MLAVPALRNPTTDTKRNKRQYPSYKKLTVSVKEGKVEKEQRILGMQRRDA